ncbi:telomere stability and silencing-domain-containing protein [Mortierella sp. GBAus27b]|nr:hypothetical protein BGX31_010561 [Mortierella sp. GBA43]KAI8355813.1 telomere stability and silencing-domain-containing protein [Mortierella sp. GBAus27b]
MEAIVSLFGANPVTITFQETSSPSLLDLKQHLFDLYQIPVEEQRIQTAGGLPLSTGNDDDDDKVLLFEDDSAAAARIRCFGLTARLNGGKGGFGSMLRAQGGRMSSQKSTNTDACRDLSGRRIKTVNDAKKMAEYIQKEPERAKAKKESLKRKIDEKLEVAERPTRKHRFEDSKFFDETEEQVDEVKSAVAAAIKKAGAAAAAVDVKGKGKAKEVVAAEKKSKAKSLGMWDDMSDYESSEGEENEEDEDEDDNDDEDDDEEAGDSDEAKVPSNSSSSSAPPSSSSTTTRTSRTSKAKVK